MNNCEIKSPPVFSQEIPKWDRNTYADGNAMGAVVEQLFNNTVYNKEELKEKVDTEGGDISETQVSVLDESTEAFPVPMSGDKAKGLWGKLKKWQQDCLAKFGERLPGETIPAESWNELTYTIEHESIKKGSTVYIGYTFESIPAAQKARIRGKTEQGKLILVAAKAPSTDIEIEEIRVLNE